MPFPFRTVPLFLFNCAYSNSFSSRLYLDLPFSPSRDFDSSSLTSFGISASSNWFSLSQQHYHTPVSGRVWPTPNSLPRIYFYSRSASPRTRARARVSIFAGKETKVDQIFVNLKINTNDATLSNFSFGIFEELRCQRFGEIHLFSKSSTLAHLLKQSR